jgi:pseudoazurin
VGYFDCGGAFEPQESGAVLDSTLRSLYVFPTKPTQGRGMNSVNNLSKLVGAVALFAALPHVGALAADHKVWMKGSGGQPMQFEPALLKIAAGDTVTFAPEDAGHNVETISGPEGTEPFVGGLDRELTVTFGAEGLYAYKCLPHLEAGMVGLIQVGDATTGADAARAADLPDKAKSRLKALLAEAGVAISD